MRSNTILLIGNIKFESSTKTDGYSKKNVKNNNENVNEKEVAFHWLTRIH